MQSKSIVCAEMITYEKTRNKKKFFQSASNEIRTRDPRLVRHAL